MKALKFKTFLLTSLIVAIVAICFSFADSNLKVCVAENSVYVGDATANFIFSAEFTPESGADEVKLVFGKDETVFAAVANVKENYVSLRKSDSTDLKKVEHEFQESKKFKLSLVLNEGIAKIYLDDNDVAVLVCATGKVEGSVNVIVDEEIAVSGVLLYRTDVLDGDIFCLGYEVLKVVNLTDGNYKLTNDDYTVVNGVLTVSENYLSTLEADKTYSFRVVTSFTDLNFEITTDFTPITAYSVVEKYYRNSDVSIEMSASATVTKVTVDEKDFDFMQNGKLVKIAAEDADSLVSGNHVVKLYTNAGRPETTFNISETVETMTEPKAVSNHLFFWIDVAIFGSLILAYVAFTVYKKSKA